MVVTAIAPPTKAGDMRSGNSPSPSPGHMATISGARWNVVVGRVAAANAQTPANRRDPTILRLVGDMARATVGSRAEHARVSQVRPFLFGSAPQECSGE